MTDPSSEVAPAQPRGPAPSEVSAHGVPCYMKAPAKPRILSGMRPTGKLHLGNLVGALENWVALQSEYQNYHLIADYHTLTTNLDASNIYKNTIDMLIDWLAAGIDPAKSPMFRQSQIKEHTELHLLFSMLITA